MALPVNMQKCNRCKHTKAMCDVGVYRKTGAPLKKCMGAYSTYQRAAELINAQSHERLKVAAWLGHLDVWR